MDPLPVAHRVADPSSWRGGHLPIAHGAAVLASFLLIASLYLWTATDGHWRFERGPPQKDLYKMQLDAFQAGQLSLLVKPSPALLALPDPYDPDHNRGSRLLDTSLFEGKYFSYFGIVPILMWMWPYAAVSGQYPATGLTTWVFVTGAFLFQAFAALRLARHACRGAAPAQVAAVLVMGTCNLMLPILRRQDCFVIPVAAGLFFTSAGAWGLLASMTERGLRTGMLAFSSAAFALAAGSRPNLLLLVPIPFLLTLLSGWSSARAPRWPVRLMAGATLPGLAIVLGLFAYNFARFHDPLEFGFKYQLVETEWKAHSPYAWRNAPFNLYYYLVSCPRLSCYFPFFLESARPPFAPPLGHDPDTAVERVVGFLAGYPILVVGTAAISAWIWRDRRTKKAALLGLAAIGVSGLLVALPFLFFAGLALRYQAEGSLALVIAAGAGVVVIASDTTNIRRCLPWLCLVVVAWLWSGFLNFFVSCETDDLFKANNPAQYADVARTFDGLIYPLERAFGWRPTDATINLQFPADRIGAEEPLLVSGDVPSADFLYVYYVTPRSVQFGFEAMGHGGPVSDQVPVDYSLPHQVDIICAPLLPPAGHPFYLEQGLGKGEFCRHILRVRLDGLVVLDALVDFHDGRERFAWGRSDKEHAFGSMFSGPLFSVGQRPFRREEVMDYLSADSSRPVFVDVRWPVGITNHREPILTFGAKNRGQIVYAHFENDGRTRIGLSDSSGREVEGTEFSVRPRGTASLRVDLPALRALSLQPKTMALSAAAGEATVVIDGQKVLEVAAGDVIAGPQALSPGKNTMQSQGIYDRFQGEIKITRRKGGLE